MKRDRYQRRAAALRRMSLAMDRVIRDSADESAKRWAMAWARYAGVAHNRT
jgi:hypothetical protein